MNELTYEQLRAAPKNILAKMYVLLTSLPNVYQYRHRVAVVLAEKCQQEVDEAAIQRLQARGVIKIIEA